jgi:glycerol 2-dehydrogenase (NADP+)
MEAVLASGKVKAIGVSNFGVPLLQKLSKTWRTVPAVNQVNHAHVYGC